MFGFFIGAITAFGFMAFARRRRLWRSYGGFGPCHHPFDHHGVPWEHGGRRGGRFGGRWLDRALANLDVTPEQGKVVRDELGDFAAHLRDMRGELKGVRHDIAEAMRAEGFDEERMGESFARQDDALRETRKKLVGSLARVHDALDDSQRRRLAAIIDRGPRARHAPYRHEA